MLLWTSHTVLVEDLSLITRIHVGIWQLPVTPDLAFIGTHTHACAQIHMHKYRDEIPFSLPKEFLGMRGDGKRKDILKTWDLVVFSSSQDTCQTHCAGAISCFGVSSLSYSSRGLKFDFQHPCMMSHKPVQLQLQEDSASSSGLCRHLYTHTYKQTNNKQTTMVPNHFTTCTWLRLMMWTYYLGIYDCHELEEQ